MSFLDKITTEYEIKAAAKDPKKVIERLLPQYEIEFRDDYSGRGMFGKVAKVAFTLHNRLTDKEKKLLEKKLGFYLSSDNMGLGVIYYA